ncbi:FKBP-type peptidyl-prolyl cis-trans isomerase [Tessaracoccus rhinocerotis]|uniref:peptidylprolyl isomerase n=1 Tax=Tessaracoccus rhinocerotis TaxID=1689449 RepID=A0A553K4C8_9ACTN|nr:FKBP-type peptidyl-prolyl cis-trans isomerase [Tessaracoccus rhinocerotis]TRY19547.1 FKBP-type peptidyl-prolyl cis-trans isomerase [Tessaracoccus rhinocerotis]
MKLPARNLAALCAVAGLLVAGCSSPDATQTDAASEATAPATTPAADTATTEAPVPESGGTCDATMGEGEADTTADAEASLAALEAVTISDDAAPTVTFDAPMSIGQEAVRVASDGDGEDLADGHLVTFNYLVCDTVTGEKLYSTWGLTAEEDAPETYVLSVANFGESLAATMDGVSTGAKLLWAQPGLTAEESSTGQAVNGFLYAMTITGSQAVADSATGADVPVTDESLPVVEIVDGKPAITVPESFTDPTELVVQPLVQGEGATVEAGQTVLVKYSGWLTDGTPFDSSWEREAPNDVFTFQAGTGGVIQGWDQGVLGQQVGSRLLLVVPSEMGYGATGSGDTIPPDATLVFVVDILAAY